MSVSQQLIARIDSLESDKTNENAPDDLSNRAAAKIESELAELDDFVAELGLSPERAQALRASFDRDLQKILDDTRNEFIDLEHAIEHDIWNHSTPQEVQTILDTIPGSTLGGVLGLLNTEYDINLARMLEVHEANPEMDFRDLKEFFFSHI